MNRRTIIIVALSAAVILAAAVMLIFGRKGDGIYAKKGLPAEELTLLDQAQTMEAKGDLSGAKQIYQKMISDHFDSAEVMSWQKKAEDLNIKLLFSPTITPKSELYQIKPGDSLARIAAAHHTTVDLIAKSNNIEGDKIFPGRKIKVWTGAFNIFVDKSQNVLILKSGEEIVKTYVVSTGKDNSTPVGVFKITNKLTDPTWFKAGAVVPASSPENVLGTRWMGFDLSGYGIHGTTEPQTLGQQVTQGCVRMANSEVEELYTIVPTGTEVTIVD